MSKEIKVYLGKESFEHRHEMRDDDKVMSPEDLAIYWMNKGREATLDQGDRHEFIERIERLESKVDEIIGKVNFIVQYYEGKGDYAGIVAHLEDGLNE